MALPPPLTWRNVNNGDATQKAILENMQKLGAAKQDVQMFEAPNVGGPLGMAGSGLTQMANALLGPEARRTAASNADLAKQREDLAMQSKLEEMMYGRSKDALAEERAVADYNLRLGTAEQQAKDAAAGRALEGRKLGLYESQLQDERNQRAKAEQVKQDQYNAQRTYQGLQDTRATALSDDINEARNTLAPYIESGQVVVDKSGTLAPNMDFFSTTQAGITSAMDSLGKPVQRGPMMNARNDIAAENTLKSNPEYAKLMGALDRFNSLNPTQTGILDKAEAEYTGLYNASISNDNPYDDLPHPSQFQAAGITAMQDAAKSPAKQGPALEAANAKLQRDADKEIAMIRSRYPGVRETETFMQDYADKSKYPQGATLGILSAMVDKGEIGGAYKSITKHIQAEIDDSEQSKDTWKDMSADERDMFMAKIIQGHGVDTSMYGPGYETRAGISSIPDELAKFRKYKEAQAEINKVQSRYDAMMYANEVFTQGGARDLPKRSK